MVFEKTGPHGERGVVPIGIGLMAFGALVMLHPGWLPGPDGVRLIAGIPAGILRG